MRCNHMDSSMDNPTVDNLTDNNPTARHNSNHMTLLSNSTAHQLPSSPKTNSSSACRPFARKFKA